VRWERIGVSDADVTHNTPGTEILVVVVSVDTNDYGVHREIRNRTHDPIAPTGIAEAIKDTAPRPTLVGAIGAVCQTVDQEDQMPDIVEIARYSSEFAGQTALAHLQAVGITAHMLTDDAGGAIPSLTLLTGGVRVVVRSEDAEAARTALEELVEDDSD